jgi:O-antigen/teichoic acid export membrane protein
MTGPREVGASFVSGGWRVLEKTRTVVAVGAHEDAGLGIRESFLGTAPESVKSRLTIGTDNLSGCADGPLLEPALGDPVTKAHRGRYQRLISQMERGVSEIQSSLGVQFYYGLGMVVQKGTPFLILPLLIYFYGDRIYASYVLFYTTVQIFGVFCSLAIPSSAIVFWYREENKRRLLVTYLSLLTGVFLVAGTACVLPLYLVYKSSLRGTLPVEMTLLGLCFVGLYVLNQYFVSLYRATYSSRKFFVAQLVGAIVLLAVVVPYHSAPTLSRLVLAFLLSFLVQDVYLLEGIKSFLGQAVWCDFDWPLAKTVLRFSLPLVLYNTIILFVYWIDKYMVSLYFDPLYFSKFVVTFQFAFAQVMVSQLFALYNFPLICELVAEKKHARLQSVIRIYNFAMAILGVGYSAAILLVHNYFHLFHIDVLGFVVLSGAFLLTNLSTTYLNVLYAHTRTKTIAIIQTVSGSLMLVVLAAGCWLKNINLCYASHFVISACVLLSFAYMAGRISQTAATSAVVVTDAVRTALGLER